MQNISLDNSSDKNKDNFLLSKDIKSWVGLPIEEYTANVEILAENLQSIDDEANESMVQHLLTDGLKEYFIDGMYAREITIPAGTALISRIHVLDSISVLSNGSIAVMDRDGYKELSAPYTFTSKAGTQRIGYALTDCTWVSLFKADKEEDMLSVITASSVEEYNRRT